MYNTGYFFNAIRRDISMIRGDTMSFSFQLKGLGGQRPEDIKFTCKETIEDVDPLFIYSESLLARSLTIRIRICLLTE